MTTSLGHKHAFETPASIWKSILKFVENKTVCYVLICRAIPQGYASLASAMHVKRTDALKASTTGIVQELARAFQNSALMKSMKDPRDYSLKHMRTHKTLIPSAEHVFRKYCVCEMSTIYTLYLHITCIRVSIRIHTCTYYLFCLLCFNI